MNEETLPNIIIWFALIGGTFFAMFILSGGDISAAAKTVAVITAGYFGLRSGWNWRKNQISTMKKKSSRGMRHDSTS